MIFDGDFLIGEFLYKRADSGWAKCGVLGAKHGLSGAYMVYQEQNPDRAEQKYGMLGRIVENFILTPCFLIFFP